MKAKFKFILGRKKTQPLNIDLEVYKGVGCRVFLSTGIQVESEKQWDATRQLVVRNPNADVYNDFLKALKTNIELAEREAEERNRIFSAEEIRRAAHNKVVFDDSQVIPKFREYIDTQLKREEIKVSSSHTYIDTIETLQRFVDKVKKQKNAPFAFAEFDDIFIKDFDIWMHDNYKSTTVHNMHVILQKFFKYAKKDRLLKVNAYEYFTIKPPKKTQRDSLTGEQLAALENIDRNALVNKYGESYEYVLDKFLFSCYCGLRFSDNNTLKKSEIVHDPRGLVVERVTIKSGQRVVLPLYMLFNGKGQKIAEKYLGVHEELDTLFPSGWESSTNLQLKRIAEFAGITYKGLSFHIARHTCASQLAEKVDNPFAIMNILGHKNIETSMIYIQRSHNAATKNLEKVDWSDDKSGKRMFDAELMNKMEALEMTCDVVGLNRCQKRMLSGELMHHADKYEIIVSWVKTLKGIQLTTEDLDERLQLLVG